MNDIEKIKNIIEVYGKPVEVEPEYRKRMENETQISKKVRDKILKKAREFFEESNKKWSNPVFHLHPIFIEIAKRQELELEEKIIQRFCRDHGRYPTIKELKDRKEEIYSKIEKNMKSKINPFEQKMKKMKKIYGEPIEIKYKNNEIEEAIFKFENPHIQSPLPSLNHNFFEKHANELRKENKK